MMLYSVISAIDAALEFLNADKLCYAAEDDEAYYFTACGDDGKPLYAPSCCRVSKMTLSVSMCYHDDPAWKTPKKEITFPKERMSHYIPAEKVWGYV